jgi:hypothetical protein
LRWQNQRERERVITASNFYIKLSEQVKLRPALFLSKFKEVLEMKKAVLRRLVLGMMGSLAIGVVAGIIIVQEAEGTIWEGESITSRVFFFQAEDGIRDITL